MIKLRHLRAGLFILLLATIGNVHARFVSVDPVKPDTSNGQNFNRYHYGNNNPYRFTDPDGRQTIPLEHRIGTNDPGITQTFLHHQGEAGAAVADFVPVIGDAKGVADAYNDPTPVNILAAGVGLLGPAGDAAGALIKGADNLVDAAKAAPNFIVSPGGTAFPVPSGASGPVPVINPSGRQTGVAFSGGEGGANGQVSTMRIMDPTPPRGSSPGYPNGYIKYENNMGQGVDPYTGRTLPNSESHYEIDQ